ncbi:hypothetical protein J4477_03145 [Candidatus Pacearchaeota archaeon]|nr:hypothetical protein [uncultured archaeon]MBS3072803.1 hypothetical protein [Candidatus Pacearchaeota archaeon]
MKVIDLKGNGQVRISAIEMDVPYLGKTITFILPLIGPDYHQNVMDSINNAKLSRPTTAQTLSLVDLALQNPKEVNCREVLTRFKENYLWTSTEGLSFSDGYIAYDNMDGKMPQTSNELVKMLDAKDQRVRLVKPGFKTGYLPMNEFLKHPVLTAHVGEEMIPIVERVAKQLNKNGGYVFAVDKSESDTKKLSAVDSGRYDVRLLLDGVFGDSLRGGYASGVRL